jgi:hypothetical protein
MTPLSNGYFPSRKNWGNAPIGNEYDVFIIAQRRGKGDDNEGRSDGVCCPFLP